MNLQRAEDKVTELLTLLQTSRSHYDLDHENYWRLAGWEKLNADLFARLPLIRKIAERAHPPVVGQLVENNRMYQWPWDECYDGCLELLGALRSSAEAEEILGPSGPQLAAQDLHPWVWHAAVDLWETGHFRSAVLDAYVKVELLTQAKVERSNVSGKALWGEIFSVDPPHAGRSRLRFVGADDRRRRVEPLDKSGEIDRRVAQLGGLEHQPGDQALVVDLQLDDERRPRSLQPGGDRAGCD